MELEQPPNGAGLILTCQVGAQTKFLLLHNKWGDRQWGFPKGHIDKEDGNCFLKTALRETQEETGIDQDQITLFSGPETDANGAIGTAVYRMHKPSRKVPSGIKHVVFILAHVQPKGGKPPAVRLSKEHTQFIWYSRLQAQLILPPAYHDALKNAARALRLP
jgi:8-oxo-dGTP pyrophosphatase MutT (NUDIX family)